MFFCLVLAGVVATPTTAGPVPVVDWASQPIAANETVLLLGGPFTAASVISLTPRVSSSHQQDGFTLPPPTPLQPSPGSVKFRIPASTPHAQWDVVVDGSAPYTLNAPQPWWVGGDLRQVATPGGYLRVFGSCVFIQSDAVLETERRVKAATSALAAAFDEQFVEEGDARMDGLMARVQEMDAAGKAHEATTKSSSSILRLVPTARTSISTSTTSSLPTVLIHSDPENSTAWSAWFSLPKSITPGKYTVEVANQLDPENFVALGRFGSYQSPTASNVTTVDIIGAASVEARHPWKATGSQVFNVADYGPFGLPGCGPGWSKLACPIDNATGKLVSPDNFWTNATVAIERAIAAAGAAGGGVVYFPRGTYFINSTYGFEIPWNVKLEGEGKELVELIFTETYSVCTSPTCLAKPYSAQSGALAYFRGPTTGTGGWAISDLTIYFTAFHNDIFYVNSNTSGFEMQRVRVTANSFLGGSGPDKGRSPQANVSWGLQDPGAVLVILATDYLIEDCDLYGDQAVITSTSQPGYCVVQKGSKYGPAHCHGSAWGIIRSNRLYNGGTSHFMAQWKQMIFENNTVTGVSPISGGQSVGTGPGGGRAQHIYHARNTIQFVWGNDREIVTFDDAGAAYLGAVASVSPDGRTLTLADDARSTVSGEWKGWDGAAVSVLNGTGVGTWRRVVVSGIDATGNEGEFYNPRNRTWKIDRPFGFALTAGQSISITPARSRVIFEGDHFLDGGTLQFYGQAQECVVQSLVGERVAGMVAWGQWRGWYTPPCGTMGMPPCTTESADRMAVESDDESGGSKAVRLGGEMGNGIMMNTQLSYLDNEILEGNTIVRWSATGGGSYAPGFGKFYNGAKFSIQSVSIRPSTGPCKNEKGGVCHDWSQLAATTAVVYRRNVAHSNGGFQVAGGQFTTSIRDVIIEGNTVLQTNPEHAMQVAQQMHDLLNGTCIVRGNVLPV
jgi:hypothetical protein